MATQEQVAQFAEHGCVCRCLLRLRNLQTGQNRTAEDFIDEFAPQFPVWGNLNQCGGTNTALMVILVRAMGLASSLQVYRSPQLARNDFAGGHSNRALFLSEIKNPALPNPPPNPVYYQHCRLIVPRMATGDWDLVEVDDAIQPLAPTVQSDVELDAWRGNFAVFY